MPIYEYQCSSCQHTCDRLQKVHDAPITQCPQCSQNCLVRLVSAAAFQLKGTGWYATDFKDQKPTAKKSSDTEVTSTSTTTTTEKKQGTAE